MKTINVVVAGSGEMIEGVEISEGATAGDVLSGLELEGYVLMPDRDSPPFGGEETIYHQVDEGQKLIAATEVSVGREARG